MWHVNHSQCQTSTHGHKSHHKIIALMLYLRWLRWSGCSCVCRTLRVVVHMQFCKNKLPDLPIFCKTLGFKQFTNASSPSGYTYIYSRAQELCERQGGRPGLPSLIICMGYDRCGHKATPTKKQLSTELSMPWSTSDTGLNLLNAIQYTCTLTSYS